MIMQALTKEHVDAFKRLGRQDKPDALIVLKLFLPSHNFYHYFTELDCDPNSDEFGMGYGFANLNDPQCAEEGPIYIFELLNLNRTPQIDPEECKDLKGILIGGYEACWQVVERDPDFPIAKITLSEIRASVKQSA